MSTNVLAGRKILIVEDDYFIAHEMARALENVGAEILGPAPTVEDAKAILGIANPSAVILDVSLPDGLSFPIADNLIAKIRRFCFCPATIKTTFPKNIRVLSG